MSGLGKSTGDEYRPPDWRAPGVRDRRRRPSTSRWWLYPAGDALEAFDQVISLAAEGWEHDEEESQFVSSRWTRPGSEDVTFLAPGIREADVTYRRWTSPKRRSRRTAPP